MPDPNRSVTYTTELERMSSIDDAAINCAEGIEDVRVGAAAAERKNSGETARTLPAPMRFIPI
jgi:hypothetical protein